jgi:uncharacterized RDD family membrane protein YckC
MSEPSAQERPVPWVAPQRTEGPAPGIEFAPHGLRLAAFLIDLVVLLLIWLAVVIPVIVLTLLAGLLSGSAEAGVIFVGLGGAVVIWVLWLLYFPWFWARRGQTPGMKLFGLHVVRDRDGGAIGWGSAILRLIGYWINTSALYLGFIWILIDPRHRGWHDLIANTIVIKRPKG